MASKPLVFRTHAIQRMFERGVSVDDVRQVVEAGDVIEDYPNDFPFPSQLLLGRRGVRPLHIVAAHDVANGATIIVTVYEPDPTRWDASFRNRTTP